MYAKDANQRKATTTNKGRRNESNSFKRISGNSETQAPPIEGGLLVGDVEHDPYLIFGRDTEAQVDEGQPPLRQLIDQRSDVEDTLPGCDSP